MNLAAVEMSMLVGSALGCLIARPSGTARATSIPTCPRPTRSASTTSLCFDGSVSCSIATPMASRITRPRPAGSASSALHRRGRRQAPPRGPRGGAPSTAPIADYNRRHGLFRDRDPAGLCPRGRGGPLRQDAPPHLPVLGATQGVMQKGHMRFEPNINCLLTLSGRPHRFHPHRPR